MSIWQDDIFKHKNLLDVYSSSSKIKSNKFNLWALFIYSALTLTCLLLNLILKEPFLSSSEIGNLTLHWASMSLDFTLSILGFLIAGFAIFSSITNPKLFIALAQIPSKEDEELSRLHFVFFHFMLTFINYLGLFTISFLLVAIFKEPSPLSIIGERIELISPYWALTIASLAAFILGFWITSAILRLKSFIWNLYQAVLLGVVTSSVISDDQSS